MSLEGKADVIYNFMDSKLNLQKKVDIPKFGKNSPRASTFGNMYRHRRDRSPEYDTVKI